MKPPRTLVAGAMLVGLLLVGCAASDAPSPDPSSSAPTVKASAEPTATATAKPTASIVCPPTPIDVALSYELSKNAAGGVLITARSNLPDTAELMASFYADGGAYFAQEVAALVEGEVAFGPFTDDGTPLKGVYEMSITLPIARNQPEEVQECIGEAGELMTGPLVSTEEITGDQFASLDVAVTIE